MEWLRSVDLAEYAPNLRGSGVHGGLMVRLPDRNLTSEAMILKMCSSLFSTCTRGVGASVQRGSSRPPAQHPSQQNPAATPPGHTFSPADRLRGAAPQTGLSGKPRLHNPHRHRQGQGESCPLPHTNTSPQRRWKQTASSLLLQPRRLSFGGFGTLRKKRPEESEEYICPMNLEMPKSSSFQRGVLIYEENLDHLEQVLSSVDDFSIWTVYVHACEMSFVWLSARHRWKTLKARSGRSERFLKESTIWLWETTFLKYFKFVRSLLFTGGLLVHFCGSLI